VNFKKGGEVEKQKLTVCFADLTNFRLLVETIGIEKTYEHLQEVFKIAGDKIIQYGGTIRKYIGDTILFTFDNPVNAVNAANEIAGYIKEVGEISLRFNIGIATGEVLLVKLGHPSFLVEDILGRTVNEAAMNVKKARENESGVAYCKETEKLLGR